VTTQPATDRMAALRTATLKRVAWAYGCARKGSPEEKQLRELLLEKLAEEDPRW
jgi:hypothetical protein